MPTQFARLLPDRRLSLIVVLLVTAWLYWPGLSGGFFFDDDPNIVRNEAVHAARVDWHSLAPALGTAIASPFGRPLANLSFALNHALAGGLTPFPFKLANLLLHLANGALLYLVTSSLVRQLPAKFACSPAFPLWVTATWLVLPLNLTTVLFVSQRMTELATFFMLAATWSWLAGRRYRGSRRWVAWGLTVGGLWPLAFLSKETALLWPLLVASLEYGFWKPEESPPGARRITHAALLSFAAAGLAASAYLFLQAPDWLSASYALREFSLPERLLTESRALWYYQGLLFWPRMAEFGLFHDDFPISRGLLEPWTTGLALAGWAIALVVAARLWRKKPWLAVGMTWFLIAHVLESTILPLELVHEHRNYLPSVGILWGLGSLLFPAEPSSRARHAAVVLALAFLANSALATNLRARAYGDDQVRACLEADYHPSSARSNYEAGLTLVRYAGAGGQPIDALTASRVVYYYQKAEAASPSFKLGDLGLIHLACYNQTPLAPEWIADLSHRLRNTPLALADRTMLGDMLEMTRSNFLCLDGKQLESLFEAAFRNPALGQTAQLRLRLPLADVLLAQLHDPVAANRQLDRIEAIEPHRVDVGLTRARTALFSGDREALRRVLAALDPAPMDSQQRAELATLKRALASLPTGR